MIFLVTNIVLVFSDGSFIFSNYRSWVPNKNTNNIFFQNDLISLTHRFNNNFKYKSSPSVYKIQYIQKR